MERILSSSRWSAAVLAAALLTVAFDAAALDGYRDRKGAFMGLGVGGGAAVQSGEVGGEAGFDLEVGGGAAKWLTLSLDLDTRMQHVSGYTNWMFVPGVQVDFIVLNALILSAGVGIAFVFPDEELMPDDDFTMGFDGMVGLGYEFFVGSDVAIDLELEGDYFALDNMDDVFAVGFWLGFRYY
jgi:hypothetical protein